MKHYHCSSAEVLERLSDENAFVYKTANRGSTRKQPPQSRTNIDNLGFPV